MALNQVELVPRRLDGCLGPAARRCGISARESPILGVGAAALKGHAFALAGTLANAFRELVRTQLCPIDQKSVASAELQDASFVGERYALAGGARPARQGRPGPCPWARSAQGPRHRIAGRINIKQGSGIRRHKKDLTRQQKPAGDRGAAPRPRRRRRRRRILRKTIGIRPKKPRKIQNPIAKASKLREPTLAWQGIQQKLANLEFPRNRRHSPTRINHGAIPWSTVRMKPTGQKRKLHNLAGPARPWKTARIRKPMQGSTLRVNPRRQPPSARPTRQGNRIKRIERRSSQRKGMPPVHLKGTVGQQTQNSALARAQRRPLQSTRARTQDTPRRLPRPRQRRPLRIDLQRPSTQRLIHGLVHVGLHATPCHALSFGAFYRPKCRSRSQRKRNVPKRQGIRPG